MKLLLRESVRGLGKRGEVVDVSPGYARNYLLPGGLAMAASQDAVRQLAAEKRVYDERLAKERESAQEMADAISKIQLTIPVKASPEGHLFGSVTPKVIVEAFLKEEITLRAQQVELESDHIRELGTYSFNIHLHEGVELQSRVWIVAEKE